MTLHHATTQKKQSNNVNEIVKQWEAVCKNEHCEGVSVTPELAHETLETLKELSAEATEFHKKYLRLYYGRMSALRKMEAFYFELLKEE